MSEINKLTVNGKVYDLADATARQQVELAKKTSENILTYIKITDITGLLQEEGGINIYGNLYNDADFRRSDYIYLQKGHVITGNNIRTSKLIAIAVYSENKVFDSGNSVQGSASVENYILTMPYDGYVRLCCRLTELNAGGTFSIANSIGNQFSAVDSNVSALHSAAATVSKYTVNAEAIAENPNTYILENLNGTLATTGDQTGCSDFRACKPGDKLKYKLSVNTNWVLLATYDKDCNLVTCVKGTGQSSFIEGEYTFAEGEAYFRISGVIAYLANYYAEFIPVHNYKIGLEMADVEEAIGNALGADTLPHYYTDYMTERVAAINNKDCLIGNHGDSFVFITDTHTPRNKMNSPALIKEIVNNSSVRFVINGGDTIDNHETWDEAVGILREWRNLMRGIPEYRVMGNHDLNSISDVEDSRLSEDDWYGTMVKPTEDMVKTDGKYYFCIDNESQKIRYICLSYLNGRTAERTWFKQRLTELGSGWTVLVIPHYLFGSTTDVIHANGQYVINDINEVYGNMNATLIGVLAGHTHADYSTTEVTNGYHLIATTCDAFTGTPTKTAGTTTEQAFDVIHIDTANRKLYATRIGAGEDRQWDY